MSITKKILITTSDANEIVSLFSDAAGEATTSLSAKGGSQSGVIALALTAAVSYGRNMVRKQLGLDQATGPTVEVEAQAVWGAIKALGDMTTRLDVSSLTPARAALAQRAKTLRQSLTLQYDAQV